MNELPLEVLLGAKCAIGSVVGWNARLRVLGVKFPEPDPGQTSAAYVIERWIPFYVKTFGFPRRADVGTFYNICARDEGVSTLLLLSATTLLNFKQDRDITVDEHPLAISKKWELPDLL
jgi:hypothetical protein